MRVYGEERPRADLGGYQHRIADRFSSTRKGVPDGIASRCERRRAVAAGTWPGKAASRPGLRSRLLVGVLVPGVAGAASLHAVTASAAPDFGPSVKVIDPSMSLSDIKATLDSISAQQVPSQFGTGRYAVLFMPGTYGTAQNPLKFQVGYYR
jgi:hypothetical protein